MSEIAVISYPYEKIFISLKLEGVSYEDFIEEFTKTDEDNPIEPSEGFNPLEHYELNETSVSEFLTTLMYNGPADEGIDASEDYYDIYINFMDQGDIFKCCLNADTFDMLEGLIAEN